MVRLEALYKTAILFPRAALAKFANIPGRVEKPYLNTPDINRFHNPRRIDRSTDSCTDPNNDCKSSSSDDRVRGAAESSSIQPPYLNTLKPPTDLTEYEKGNKSRIDVTLQESDTIRAQKTSPDRV